MVILLRAAGTMAPFPGLVHDDLGGAHARAAAIPSARSARIAATQAAARHIDEVTPRDEERDLRARADLHAHRRDPPGNPGFVGVDGRTLVAFVAT